MNKWAKRSRREEDEAELHRSLSFAFLPGLFFVVVKIFIFLFYCLAVLGLHCCMRTFSSCSKQGLLFIVICGLLIAVAPPVAEQALGRMGFSSCDLWTQELRLVGSGAQAQ